MIREFIARLFAPRISAGAQREAVVSLLDGRRPMSGRQLRERLRLVGVRLSRVGFYALMARMEENGDVVGWYQVMEINGVPCRERRYRLPGSGR